jgi:hypothetical protein
MASRASFPDIDTGVSCASRPLKALLYHRKTSSMAKATRKSSATPMAARHGLPWGSSCPNRALNPIHWPSAGSSERSASSLCSTSATLALMVSIKSARPPISSSTGASSGAFFSSSISRRRTCWSLNSATMASAPLEASATGSCDGALAAGTAVGANHSTRAARNARTQRFVMERPLSVERTAIMS